jgi:hypothetical protein
MKCITSYDFQKKFEKKIKEFASINILIKNKIWAIVVNSV